MRILMYEIRKAILSPVILALLVLFVSFNFFLIYENRYIKDDLRKVNQLANTYGTEINDEMLKNMQSDYEGKMVKVNEITNKTLGKTYQNMTDIYRDKSFYFPEKFSEKEMRFFSDTGLLEFYYFFSLNIDESFLSRDPIESAEIEIREYRISGAAAELIRSQYNKLTDRYNEVHENKEYKHLFPAQSVFNTHLLLFKTLFKAMLLESLILTVLVTAYVINYEFDRGTYLLAYSSKRGRKLWLDKLWAALITNVSMLTIVLATGLAAYFSMFSYQEFWYVPISSYFNAGKEWFLSWWNLSFIEYLAAVIFLAYLLMMLFTLMTVVIARWIRNSYLVFFTFLCLFGIIFVNQALMSKNSILFLFGYFTPVNLILNSFIWFMQRASTFTAYFEMITVVAWFVILLLSVMYCSRSFQKCDLK